MSYSPAFEKAWKATDARFEALHRMTKNQRNRLMQYEKNQGVLLSGEEIIAKFIPNGISGGDDFGHKRD